MLRIVRAYACWKPAKVVKNEFIWHLVSCVGLVESWPKTKKGRSALRQKQVTRFQSPRFCYFTFFNVLRGCCRTKVINIYIYLSLFSRNVYNARLLEKPLKRFDCKWLVLHVETTLQILLPSLRSIIMTNGYNERILFWAKCKKQQTHTHIHSEMG